MLSGIINFDKPAGLSSARVVGRVKRLLPRGVKIGHAGTLDPFATGVLLLLVGRATRRCESLMGETKVYETVVKLGATTPTLDPESAEIATAVDHVPAKDQIVDALIKMTGRILQVPPAYSAMKVGGRRAYDLARRGQNPVLKPREVRIDRIELLEYHWPRLSLRIECGRGTYIRAIARDLGEAMNVGGYLISLRRTRVGRFRSEGAVTFDQLDNGIERHLQPVEDTIESENQSKTA